MFSTAEWDIELEGNFGCDQEKFSDVISEAASKIRVLQFIFTEREGRLVSLLLGGVEGISQDKNAESIAIRCVKYFDILARDLTRGKGVDGNVAGSPQLR